MAGVSQALGMDTQQAGAWVALEEANHNAISPRALWGLMQWLGQLSPAQSNLALSVEPPTHVIEDEKHMQACLQGEIPKITPNVVSSYHSRAILYAKSKYRVSDLTSLNFVRDIPKIGYIIDRGDPICSVIAHSSSRKKCLDNLKRYANLIYRKCPG